MRRRSTGGFWRPEILLISCVSILSGLVLMTNAVAAAIDDGGPLMDITINMLVGLFLLLGGLWGYTLGQGMRHDDERDIRRSHDLIENLIFASAFLMLANLVLNAVSFSYSVGPAWFIISVLLSLVFWFYVLRE